MFRTPSLVYDVCYEVENHFIGNLFRIHPMQLREVLMNQTSKFVLQLHYMLESRTCPIDNLQE